MNWGWLMAPTNGEYGQIAGTIERQQRHIHELEAENRDLRRQLDELRRGIGVAIMIHGRAIPLAPLPYAGSSLPSNGPALAYGAGQVSYEQPSVAVPARQSYAKTPPAPAHAGSGQPSAGQQPHAQPSPTFPESAWLTGPAPALRPSPRFERTPLAEPRPLTPTQEMTPSWLREEAHTPHRRAQTEAASDPELQTWRAAPLYTPRSNVPQDSLLRPVHLEPAPMRTLAQITGQQRAVRPNDPADRRTPFSDSFVLG